MSWCQKDLQVEVLLNPQAQKTKTIDHDFLSIGLLGCAPLTCRLLDYKLFQGFDRVSPVSQRKAHLFYCDDERVPQPTLVFNFSLDICLVAFDLQSASYLHLLQVLALPIRSGTGITQSCLRSCARLSAQILSNFWSVLFQLAWRLLAPLQLLNT